MSSAKMLESFEHLAMVDNILKVNNISTAGFQGTEDCLILVFALPLKETDYSITPFSYTGKQRAADTALCQTWAAVCFRNRRHD
jgi:hypothetical protein